MNRKLLLVRHGETEDNFDGRFAASDDTPLSERGVDQIQQTARQLCADYSPDLLLTSAPRRARQSAELLAEVFGLEVSVLPGIQERGFGCLRGQVYARMGELMMADPVYDPAHLWNWSPEGGESLEDVRARAINALNAVGAMGGGVALVVTHGAVIQAVCAHLTGRWDESFVPMPGQLVIIEYTGTLQPGQDCKVLRLPSFSPQTTIDDSLSHKRS